jgi:hypothetical protein
MSYFIWAMLLTHEGQNLFLHNILNELFCDFYSFGKKMFQRKSHDFPIKIFIGWVPLNIKL